jgi:predicted nucleic acid-binding protein
LLVVDATVAFDGAFDSIVFERIERDGPVAPPLLWSEVTAALRQSVFRSAVDSRDAGAALDRFLASPIERRAPRRLYEIASVLAEELGWAKTYDAEYVALAQILGCPLLTKDGRLARRVAELVEIRTPTDL